MCVCVSVPYPRVDRLDLSSNWTLDCIFILSILCRLSERYVSVQRVLTFELFNGCGVLQPKQNGKKAITGNVKVRVNDIDVGIE